MMTLSSCMDSTKLWFLEKRISVNPKPTYFTSEKEEKCICLLSDHMKFVCFVHFSHLVHFFLATARCSKLGKLILIVIFCLT